MKGHAETVTDDAFVTTLVHLQESLFFYALQLTEDTDDASDLVQETSYKALRNRNRLLNTTHFRAWLYTILRNTHINYLRSSHYRQISNKNEGSRGLSENGIAVDDPGPEEIMLRNEVRELVSRLPKVYERPISMMLSGYSYKEIARQMDIPIGTVKSRIHLGKKRIKKVYSA